MDKMDNLKSGIPIVISAPSGAGKSTIAAKIIEANPSIVQSISCTTRPARKDEKNGVHYFFMSVDEFKKKIEQGDFLEWAIVHDHYYGTPVTELERRLKEGKDVILAIDPQGALTVKRLFPKGVYIFVVPPSWDMLLKRLKSRATDDSSTVQIRVANAQRELTYVSHYDYLVVNDQLEEAVHDLSAIIRAEHRRLPRVSKDDLPIFRHPEGVRS